MILTKNHYTFWYLTCHVNLFVNEYSIQKIMYFIIVRIKLINNISIKKNSKYQRFNKIPKRTS